MIKKEEFLILVFYLGVVYERNIINDGVGSGIFSRGKFSFKSYIFYWNYNGN